MDGKSGSVAILNVGAGDTKLSFDRNNPAECIRAARIVKDMLRRGYALLVEVERDGQKAFERALDFREDTFEYVIADFDPIVAEEVDAREKLNSSPVLRVVEGTDGEGEQTETGSEDSQARVGSTAGKGRRGGKRSSVPANGTRAVAVARSAGG